VNEEAGRTAGRLLKNVGEGKKIVVHPFTRAASKMWSVKGYRELIDVKVSVIIVNHNGLAYTINAVASIRRYSSGAEIIVVDNGSTDESNKVLHAQFPDIHLVTLSENKGFGAGNNRGAEAASGALLFFVNNDTVLTSDIIRTLTEFMETKTKCGVAAPVLRNDDGSFQLSYGKFPSITNEINTQEQTRAIESMRKNQMEQKKMIEKIDWVTGAAMMVRRSVFEQVGGFDEKYFMYFEDVDFCKRVAQAGYSIDYLPRISLIHFKGKSYEESDAKIPLEYRRSQLRFYDKFQPFSERFAIRIYLFIKFFSRLVFMRKKATSLAVIALLFRKQS
jgi:GT2 family glycosyltransferase